ncbi:restriction endonuclease subunit S [Streptococcus parasuis]
MSEWKQTKLGDLLKIKHGYAFKSSDYVQESSFPLVTLKSISESSSFYFDESKATYYGGDIPAEYILNQGDLIIPLTEQVIGLLGNSAFVPKINKYTFLLNQRVGKIINDENKVDRVYLKYLMSTSNVRNQMEYRAHGTKQRNISPKDIYDITVIIPAIKTQKEIGLILKNIEDKITLNNKINEELEAMAKTLYDYWFVQFDFPDENGKPYKSSGGKMVYNDQLKREIPEGWGVARLDQLQIATGKRDANFGTENGKYDFWTTANSPIKADEFSFEGKAILIAGNGNFYVNFTDGKFEAYQRTYVIQSEDEKMLIFMYMACLQSAEKLRKASNGSIIKYITIGDVNNISSPYDHNVVDEFVKIYRPLIDQISKNKKQNQELTKLRDWLLPMLMNGQARVEDKT